MGNAPKSARSGNPKVLDVERTIPQYSWVADFSDIEGFEKLTAKNFSIISLRMRTHAEHGNFGPTKITSYDSETGTLTLTGSPYTSTTGGTFRITFGNIE